MSRCGREGEGTDALDLKQGAALDGVIVAAVVRDVEQAVEVIELEILSHGADGLRGIIAGEDGGGESVQHLVAGDLVAIQGAVHDAAECVGMQEVIKQAALDGGDAIMELRILAFVAMIKAAALQLNMRVEFRRRGKRVGGEGVFRQHGEGLALPGGLDRFEGRDVRRLTLDGAFDIDAADVT
jgi:hypothetical protein